LVGQAAFVTIASGVELAGVVDAWLTSHCPRDLTGPAGQLRHLSQNRRRLRARFQAYFSERFSNRYRVPTGD
jgi:hypothetical protein